LWAQPTRSATTWTREYKHVVLGLISLNTSRTRSGRNTPSLKRIKTKALILKILTNIARRASFGCRRKRGGKHLKANAPQSTIGTMVDDAMTADRAGQPVAQECGCRKISAAPVSTSSASVRSSIW